LASPNGVPLFIVPTDWIKPMDGGIKVDRISANSEITLEGCIRGVIFQDRLKELTSLPVQDTIRLMARLPKVEMKLDFISIEKTITIQYPMKLEVVSCPRWIAPGSKSDISWKVHNTLKCLTKDHKYW
jgi:hypothetical protein